MRHPIGEAWRRKCARAEQKTIAPPATTPHQTVRGSCVAGGSARTMFHGPQRPEPGSNGMSSVFGWNGDKQTYSMLGSKA